jgi:CDGSH-type Zn-finger protein
MAQVSIKALRNGPYEVSGAVDVMDSAGDTYPTDGQPLYLCRCGRSAGKPFCDGMHKKAGFHAEQCVRQTDGR